MESIVIVRNTLRFQKRQNLDIVKETMAVYAMHIIYECIQRKHKNQNFYTQCLLIRTDIVDTVKIE